jgi:hypothetical protein
MKIRRTAHFDRNYTRAPQEIQQAFDQAIAALAPESAPSFLASQEILKRPGWPDILFAYHDRFAKKTGLAPEDL